MENIVVDSISNLVLPLGNQHETAVTEYDFDVRAWKGLPILRERGPVMPVVMAIIGYLFLAYCAWALCKAAGDADGRAEKDHKTGRAE